MQQEHVRFSGFPWYDELPKSVMIGGAGGIGSWLAFFLTRANFKVHIFDDDTVERHNLAGQLFRESDIGKLKVAAVEDMVKNYNTTLINTYPTKVTEDSPSSHFVFSAFDNMKAREVLFDRWREYNGETSHAIFIDGRLEGEQMQVFCVTAETADSYKRDHLFSDAEVPDMACTLKQTTHSAAMVATLMVSFFTNHITNVVTLENLREVPFYHEYFIPLNITEDASN